jgi:hypothetical protein
VRFLADGSGLIINQGRDRVERWDLGADRPKWSIAENTVALAVAPDGKHFAISVAKGVSIRSAGHGSEARLISAIAGPRSNVMFQVRVGALAFFPDGSLVAETRWDAGDVFVRDVAARQEVRRLVGHPVPNDI